VFVTSSFGEGEPPDNAKAFFEWMRKPHRAGLLENLRYTVCVPESEQNGRLMPDVGILFCCFLWQVFGLGALRSYGNRYQAAPKELDARIHDLGTLFR
jgi:hypothetical protein